MKFIYEYPIFYNLIIWYLTQTFFLKSGSYISVILIIMIQAQARNPRQTAVVDMLLLPLPLQFDRNDCCGII